MKLPKSFIRRHQPTNSAACQAIRRDACRVLRRFAGDMALSPREYTIREHRQRRRDVDVFALHTDSLLIEIQHPAGAEGGVLMSYRTCRGRNDLTGGRDNAVSVDSLASDQGYANLVATLRVVAGRRS
ncbi:MULTISPECIES: hypothetical protein [Cupriavidus]|uniref:hypothetical protein n=1 Tax=Cupriavidus TaxID=106589 RepID=UPI0012471F78|nr:MULTISPECIES: hypothetical protein [Cupriavidus]KAB0599719.1 hypothetical protein F7R19_24545 [Cupriavidus pauculus]MBY4733514.1 hypothetical protein [Cupriavidus pauculus]UAL03749.1 hypothetical protein K8O84_28750 [Cupriavidus pauculus]